MDVVGLFQEPLEAMFALINEMEMAIKINTSIIFGNRARLMWVKFNRLRVGLCPRKKKKKEVEHERVLRALLFVVGCVKRLFLVYF